MKFKKSKHKFLAPRSAAQAPDEALSRAQDETQDAQSVSAPAPIETFNETPMEFFHNIPDEAWHEIPAAQAEADGTAAPDTPLAAADAPMDAPEDAAEPAAPVPPAPAKKAPGGKKYPFWPALIACAVLPVYLECVLHLLVYGAMSSRIVYPVLFALAAGAVLYALSTIFPAKANAVIALVLGFLLTFYFEVQLVYNSIFGEFMSVWQISFGATAITNFFSQMVYGILRIWWKILLLLAPWVAMLVLVCLKKLQFPRQKWFVPLCALAALFATHYLSVGVMALNDRNAFSVRRLYTNPNTATEISVKNIGLLSTARLECKYLLLGVTTEPEPAVEYPVAEPSEEEPETLDTEKYNVIDIDFAALAGETDNATLQKLDRYFEAAQPTEKNEYTGLFEGYNLITICAESFSPYVIDEQRTPTLYKLATGGFVFHNYYGTYASNTTNGEYTMCTGLYPDLSRSKSSASFYASQMNYLPFCLGNEFKTLGASAWAYHNYTGEYYSRNETHPNMGYIFQSATDGLDITLSWPSSDYEMMVESVDDYLSTGEPFTAYYMTFSGHYQYNWDNPMSAKNRDIVADLPYSESVKAYLACNQELETALTYLVDRLEQAGVADKTVIVLTNDHYPYGLSAEEYNELAGTTVDTTFERFRNSFICYVPGMHVDVDTYCSTADILPTLLNLFGLEYDSRLLAGRDVLSPQAKNYAVLSDQSFVTADYGFDTSTGEVRFFRDGVTLDDSELERIQKEIALDFQVSLDVLGADYYAHALLNRPAAAEEERHIEEYPFTDIPDTLLLGALDYVYENGYMEPMSETKFGFDADCAYAELLDVLYRVSGSPDMGGVYSVYLGSTKALTGKYAPAVSWAKNNNLISYTQYEMDSFTPVMRKSAAVTLYQYAQMQGFDTSVDEADLANYIAKYPNLRWSEARALYWCYKSAVMRGGGTMDSVFSQADNIMTRYYVVSAVYNFYLYFVE